MSGVLAAIPLVLAALVTVAPLAACGSSVRTPGPAGQGGKGGVPENYPFTVVDSKEHQDSMAAEWTRLFEAYNVPPERRKVPELNPVTHTPKSILGIGPIRLVAATGNNAPPDEEKLRLLLRDFVSEHAQLLGVSAANLSLEGVTDAGKLGKRYAFVQAGYPYPIVPPAGRLEFVVNSNGEILQISDTAIPRAEMPEPTVTREAAEQRVVGTTFTYSDIAGRRQTTTVTDPKAVAARRLVIYPEETEAALRIHVAWEVEAGAGMTWTVYVDAVTGAVIATRQNFQT